MGSLADTKKASFSSFEGGFSLDLPKSTGGFSGRRGTQYSWRLTEGYYFVGVEDRNSEIEGSAEIFEKETTKVADSLFSDIARDLFSTKYEIESIERKTIEYLGHRGIELQAKLTDVQVFIRIFWIGSRAYKLAAVLTPQQQPFISRVLPVFDSMKIASKESIDLELQKKVAENTPKSLPQAPVIAKIMSDAVDDRLKGKVKTVIQENQFVKGVNAGAPKRKDFEAFYNEAGNLIKEIAYDSTSGYPQRIEVYGYLKRKRVSRSNFISYGNELGGIAIIDPPGVSKLRDNRYDFSYLYKYDQTGRQVQKTTYDNAGRVWTKLINKYGVNSVDVILYDQDGKQNNHNQLKLNERGDVVEAVNFNSPVEGWQSTYTYKYEEFDKQENWTKRIVTKSRTFLGVTKEEWTMVETRSISYF